MQAHGKYAVGLLYYSGSNFSEYRVGFLRFGFISEQFGVQEFVSVPNQIAVFRTTAVFRKTWV
jgi:hypothetical protein